MKSNKKQSQTLSEKLMSYSTRFQSFLASKVFLKITLCWFVIQGLLFSTTTRIGLPPDENYHLAYIKLFANNNFSPIIENTPQTFELGDIARTPFFIYHYLFGIFDNVFMTDSTRLIVMRLINLMIAAGSLWLVYKIATYIKVSPLVRNLSIFMLANTLMFVFLSAAVSYDNLFILLSLASILLTLQLIDKVTALRILSLLSVLGLGSLTKVNFLGMAAPVIIILAFYKRSSLEQTWGDIKSSFTQNKRLNIVLCIVLGLISLLVIHRYGYNAIKYHSYSPACETVMSVSACRNNALFVRNERVFGPAKIAPDKNPLEYVLDWAPIIQDRTFGIYAHKELTPHNIVITAIQAYIVLALVAIIRLWKKSDKQLTILLIISLFYIGAVITENYQIYLGSGRISFVVHGRYLFAVLPVLYLIANHYILRLLTGRIQKLIFLLGTVTVFFVSALPTYAIRADSTWLSPQAKSLIEKLL